MSQKRRGTQVTPMERVRWAREVVRLREEGMTWAEVAAATGKSQATCKRLEKSLREAGDPDAPTDRMAWVWERFDAIRVVMDEASATYAAAPEGSATRVGALKLFNQASSDVVDLASRVGFLPQQLGALSAEQQMQTVFRDFSEILRKHDASDAMLTELLTLADRRLAGSRPGLTPAA